MTAPVNGSTLSRNITVSAIVTAGTYPVDHVTFRLDGPSNGGIASDSSFPYQITFDTTAISDGSHTFSVRAVDTQGNTSTQPDPTVTVTVNNGSGGGGGGGGGSGVVLSGEGSIGAGLPRSDATCAAAVIPTPENRPNNTAANRTVPPNNGANVAWGDEPFLLFMQEQALVTGRHTGTTDEILQYYACRWGLPADLLRADAVDESHWNQSSVGDVCGSAGEASYGILQIKNRNCSGSVIHGGYPDTQTSTPVNVDYTAMHDRACFDGGLQGYIPSGGQTITQAIAAHENYSDPVPLTGHRGEDYALWGCVGQWYSGGWWDSGASSYVSTVQGYYVTKPWLLSGF